MQLSAQVCLQRNNKPNLWREKKATDRQTDRRQECMVRPRSCLVIHLSFFSHFFSRVIQEQTCEINTGNRCLHRIEAERSRSLWESDEYVQIDPHHPRFLHGWTPGHDLISPVRRSTSAPNQLVHTEASLILKEEAVSKIDRSPFRTRRKKCRYSDYQNM